MDSVPPISIPASRLQNFEVGSRLEWIETDGRGGYASSTTTGTNTRRYHGLLVVARRPPTDRVVLLSRLEESILTPDGRRFDLATNVYPGAIHPQGYLHLEEFRLDPWPIWRFRFDELTLTRALFLAREPGAVVLLYRVEGGSATLAARPLIAGRDFHALVTANDAVTPSAEAMPGQVTYHAYPGIPPLVLSHDEGEWRDNGTWYLRTIYPIEAERGLDDREDLYSPGILTAQLEPGRPWRLACSTRPVPIERVGDWATDERRRRAAAAERGRRVVGNDPELGELGARLGLAAEDYLVRRGDGLSILAGYPWFADWGRDAMISIPGLCLLLGRSDRAASVLRTFAEHLRDGLIPNRFPDYGGPVPHDHYNAVDASLWFIEAVGALGAAGGDAEEFWPAVRQIVEAYRGGTRYGIRMDSDGLVRQGIEGVQLTWMDARVDGWVVTPRRGKAVEINALWYNALHRAATLAKAVGRDPGLYEALGAHVRDAFTAFWYDEGGYLYDLIDDHGVPDPTLRPNQLFAISLPHSPLDLEKARSVVDVVEQHLLVPLGVRTLAPGDPLYRGHYGGTQRDRDAAYHCGTAWPWLLGPFITAYLRVHGLDDASRARVLLWLEPVRRHLHDFGLGQIAEVVAGDPPYEVGGCFAQAWSCAEVLRILPLIRSAGLANGTDPR